MNIERGIIMSIDKSIANAVASVKMEGFQIDDECVLLCKELLEQKITLEQYISIIIEKVGVSSV